MAEPEDEEPEQREGDESREEREPGERESGFRRARDSLLGSLFGDSTAAFKRGQGLVTGVAQGTKEELMRIFSHEVRGFLDKMDAVDLVQQIVSGMVIEMKTEIRFRRDETGKLEPEIRTTETKVAHDKPSAENKDKDD